MNLVDQMQTYVRVVESGSLSMAARSTRMSTAAVSRQIAALENELGATLLVRTTRRLQVTEAGQRWYQHCVRILRDVEDARLDVSDARTPSGKVTISVGFSMGLWHVVPRVEGLLRRYPRLEIDLRLEDNVIDLVTDAVDIAVRGGFSPPDSASLIATPLTQFERVTVAAAGYLRVRGTPKDPRELERHDCLTMPAPFARWRFQRNEETVEVTPHSRVRCVTPAAVREFALAGLGIAQLPAWLVSGDKSLRRLFPGWTIAPIRVWALHRVELRGLPRINAVVDALRA
jgi:DNA-binding transcriptional LysR family regulator